MTYLIENVRFCVMWLFGISQCEVSNGLRMALGQGNHILRVKLTRYDALCSDLGAPFTQNGAAG